jgi:hypothetical protein
MFQMEMRSAFDMALVEAGPPAVFTIDAKGQLGLDEWRTREHYGRIDGPLSRALCHCLYRDRATGFVQYVLVSSPQLCAVHPRQDISRYPDQQTALEVLQGLGNPPLSPQPLPVLSP